MINPFPKTSDLMNTIIDAIIDPDCMVSVGIHDGDDPQETKYITCLRLDCIGYDSEHDIIRIRYNGDWFSFQLPPFGIYKGTIDISEARMIVKEYECYRKPLDIIFLVHRYMRSAS